MKYIFKIGVTIKFVLPKDYPDYPWFHFISVNGYHSKHLCQYNILSCNIFSEFSLCKILYKTFVFWNASKTGERPAFVVKFEWLDQIPMALRYIVIIFQIAPLVFDRCRIAYL